MGTTARTASSIGMTVPDKRKGNNVLNTYILSYIEHDEVRQTSEKKVDKDRQI